MYDAEENNNSSQEVTTCDVHYPPLCSVRSCVVASFWSNEGVEPAARYTALLAVGVQGVK